MAQISIISPIWVLSIFPSLYHCPDIHHFPHIPPWLPPRQAFDYLVDNKCAGLKPYHMEACWFPNKPGFSHINRVSLTGNTETGGHMGPIYFPSSRIMRIDASTYQTIINNIKKIAIMHLGVIWGASGGHMGCIRAVMAISGHYLGVIWVT